MNKSLPYYYGFKIPSYKKENFFIERFKSLIASTDLNNSLGDELNYFSRFKRFKRNRNLFILRRRFKKRIL
jgi:hypothetical protein